MTPILLPTPPEECRHENDAEGAVLSRVFCHLGRVDRRDPNQRQLRRAKTDFLTTRRIGIAAAPDRERRIGKGGAMTSVTLRLRKTTCLGSTTPVVSLSSLERGFSEVFPALLAVCFVLALTLFPSVAAHAQVTGATLSGTVTDATGAVIPGVMVSIKNTATGVVRSLKTDEAGFYSAPNLLAGSYEVTASAPGFSTVVQSNILLTVGAQQQLNISMKVGESAQLVEVTEAAPLVQLTSSVISGEVQSTTIRELPLNGRDWASLATLSPGVNAIETQIGFETGTSRGNRGFGAQLSISGGRPTQNNYRLDGNSINDFANGGPGSVLGVSLGVDEIKEFSVHTGNYSE